MSDDDPEQRDLRVIAANYAEGTSDVQQGARAYLIGGTSGDGGARRIWLVRSRGGRWVRKWRATKTMRDIRYKTVSAENEHLYRLLKAEDAERMTTSHAWFVGYADPAPDTDRPRPLDPALRPALFHLDFPTAVPRSFIGQVVETPHGRRTVVSCETLPGGGTRVGYGDTLTDDYVPELLAVRPNTATDVSRETEHP